MIKKICLIMGVVLFVLGCFPNQEIKGMSPVNCSECLKSCPQVLSKGVKVASTLDLGISFVSNIVRCVYEDNPVTAGLRAIYSPLSWIENKWVRIGSNLFLIFPAVNIFSSKCELLFSWLGALPAFCIAASTLGGGFCYLLAKCGCYKSQWKTAAANQLTNNGQQKAADWVNALQ